MYKINVDFTRITVCNDVSLIYVIESVLCFDK